MTKEDPTPGALAGLRVVEVGEWVSAPFAARLFADFGADGLFLWRCGSVAVACSLLRRRGPGGTRLGIQRAAPLRASSEAR